MSGPGSHGPYPIFSRDFTSGATGWVDAADKFDAKTRAAAEEAAKGPPGEPQKDLPSKKAAGSLLTGGPTLGGSSGSSNLLGGG